MIPIAVFISIDAGTASSSAFQRTLKIVHDHAGILVHVHLESAVTMRWKPRSPWAGICTRAQLNYNSGYQTSRDNAFFTYQDSFLKVDASVTWASADKKLTVQAYINNATNKIVSTSTDITPAPNFQAYADYEPPRNFGVRVGYNF